MPLWQEDATGGDAMRAKKMGQLYGCLLAALVGISIKGEINDTRTVT